MITIEDVMARIDTLVRIASSHWLLTANKLLADADARSPLTAAQRARWQLIQATIRERELPL